ncbi:hypothetical protein B0H13DRAFT_2423380 [Mycena leptocephala]|nr:hypothetical protein B0H13DRAFT_2423380 [Mycena leptocephala]
MKVYDRARDVEGIEWYKTGGRRACLAGRRRKRGGSAIQEKTMRSAGCRRKISMRRCSGTCTKAPGVVNYTGAQREVVGSHGQKLPSVTLHWAGRRAAKRCTGRAASGERRKMSSMAWYQVLQSYNDATGAGRRGQRARTIKHTRRVVQRVQIWREAMSTCRKGAGRDGSAGREWRGNAATPGAGGDGKRRAEAGAGGRREAAGAPGGNGGAVATRWAGQQRQKGRELPPTDIGRWEGTGARAGWGAVNPRAGQLYVGEKSGRQRPGVHTGHPWAAIGHRSRWRAAKSWISEGLVPACERCSGPGNGWINYDEQRLKGKESKRVKRRDNVLNGKGEGIERSMGSNEQRGGWLRAEFSRTGSSNGVSIGRQGDIVNNDGVPRISCIDPRAWMSCGKSEKWAQDTPNGWSPGPSVFRCELLVMHEAAFFVSIAAKRSPGVGRESESEVVFSRSRRKMRSGRTTCRWRSAGADGACEGNDSTGVSARGGSVAVLVIASAYVAFLVGLIGAQVCAEAVVGVEWGLRVGIRVRRRRARRTSVVCEVRIGAVGASGARKRYPPPENAIPHPWRAV